MTQTFLRTLGVFCVILGVVSLLDVMEIFYFHSPLIDWMERYGPQKAWVFRLGAIALGGALIFLTPRADD